MSGPPSSRPRRPSPPPSGVRAREPPSPSLLARTLPSTATLNELTTLTHMSDLGISTTALTPLPITTETAHWSIPPTISDLAEWIIVPTIDSEPPLDTIKRILAIEFDPEYKEVVLDYPFTKDYIWSCGKNKVGRIWTVQPRMGSILESSQFERERAYRIPKPEDRQNLLDYYSHIFQLECGIEKCVFVWEEATLASQIERAVGKHGKIILARWPLKIMGTTSASEFTKSMADGAEMG